MSKCEKCGEQKYEYCLCSGEPDPQDQRIAALEARLASVADLAAINFKHYKSEKIYHDIAAAQLAAEREARERAEANARHWKAQHDEMVRRNRVLRDRPDLPTERLESYQRLVDALDLALADRDRLAAELAEEKRRYTGAVAEVRRICDAIQPAKNANEWGADVVDIVKMRFAELAEARAKQAALREALHDKFESVVIIAGETLAACELCTQIGAGESVPQSVAFRDFVHSADCPLHAGGNNET